MNTDLSNTNASVAGNRRTAVTISPWVNEPLPAWEQFLTAHDVARLARRPPWLLCGMALLRKFPKKRRFRGRQIGWLKSDVLDWMDRGSVDDNQPRNLSRSHALKNEERDTEDPATLHPLTTIFRCRTY